MKESFGVQNAMICCLNVKCGKAPGNDGLTGEFFKGLWNLLSQQLTDSLNISFEHSELSNSHGNKLLVDWLIDKKYRDRRFFLELATYSTLNVDVKLASKALALYVKSQLPYP